MKSFPGIPIVLSKYLLDKKVIKKIDNTGSSKDNHHGREALRAQVTYTVPRG